MTPIPRVRGVRATGTASTTDFGFHISAEIEKRMSGWHAGVREEVRKRLAEIAASAGKSSVQTKSLDRTEPPLRFYVYQKYRIAYQIDEAHRRVVVLGIELLPST